MRIASVLCVLLLLGLTSGLALADKEKLDEPQGHYNFQGRDTYPEVEPNEPCGSDQPVNCGDVVDPAEINPPTEDDWFSFYVTAGEAITTGTDASPGLPDVDTYIELWSPDCGTCLAEDDDGGPGVYSLIEGYTAPEDGDYHVCVHHYPHNGSGNYQVFFICGDLPTGACCFENGSCQIMTMTQCVDAGGAYEGDDTVCEPNPCPQPPPPPENDTCEGAEQYGYFLERCTSGMLSASTQYAIPDYSPTNNCTGYSQAAGKDVVWYMDLVAGDVCTFIMNESGFDAAIYVLTDCSDMNSCVVGADDPEEIMNWVVPETRRYYLVPDGYSSSDTGGPFDLIWDISGASPAAATTWSQIKARFR
jgi:hypothetical protein